MTPLSPLPIMTGVGFMVVLFGFASTWGRYVLGEAHKKNPLEAAVHALLSAAIFAHCCLLVFFEPSTVVGVVILNHMGLVAILNTLTMIFIESKRGQLGGEYYLHTQIGYFFWIINGLTITWYAPLLYGALMGREVPHAPIFRELGTIHPVVWLLLLAWLVRTAMMVKYAVYAVTHKPEPDERYNLDPTTRILSFRFYRTP